MLVPADGFDADVIQSFCHHVQFFASREAGEQWVAGREGAFLLTAPEAFRLGEMWNRQTEIDIRHRGRGDQTPSVWR